MTEFKVLECSSFWQVQTRKSLLRGENEEEEKMRPSRHSPASYSHETRGNRFGKPSRGNDLARVNLFQNHRHPGSSIHEYIAMRLSYENNYRIYFEMHRYIDVTHWLLTQDSSFTVRHNFLTQAWCLLPLTVCMQNSRSRKIKTSVGLVEAVIYKHLVLKSSFCSVEPS